MIHPYLLRFALIALIASCGTRLAWSESPSRTWTDKSGKFRIEAKLVEQTDSGVKLLKSDGRIVTVPVQSLSATDQEYLKKAANEESENPFAGGQVAAGGQSEMKSDPAGADPAASLKMLSRTFVAPEFPSRGPELFANVREQPRPLTADPLPYQTRFVEFARPLEKVSSGDRISDPILVDPTMPRFAVSIHSDRRGFARVYLVDQQEKRPAPLMDIENTLMLLDHHIESDRTLGVVGASGVSDRGGDLVLLKNLAAGQPEAIGRARLPGWNKPGFAPKVESAALLDGDRAVVRIDDDVHCWSLNNGKHIFQIKDAGADIEISGTGKYLALGFPGGCQLIDLDKAELIGTLPFGTSLRPQIQFSPDGQMLAMVAGQQYAVWDLVGGKMKYETSINTPCGEFIGWVGNKYLLTALGGLIDTERGRSVWRYQLPLSKQGTTLPNGVALIDSQDVATLLCLPMPHHSEDEGLGFGTSRIDFGRWNDSVGQSNR